MFPDKWVLVNSVALQSLAISVWTTDHPNQSFNLVCLLALISSLSLSSAIPVAVNQLKSLLLQSIVPTGAPSVLPPIPCPTSRPLFVTVYILESLAESSHRSKTQLLRSLLGEVACFLCARPRHDCQRIWCLGERSLNT